MRFLPAIAVIALTLFATNAPEIALAKHADPVWEMRCSGRVRPVPKKLKLRRGKDSIEVKDSIQLCTKHVYEFSGKTEQHFRARLSAGTLTWMIISQDNGERVLSHDAEATFGAVREWEGVLPRNGKYTLVVVTGETAPYSIEIRLR
jgi:hypothetical protein